MKWPAKVNRNAVTGKELQKRQAEYFESIDDCVRKLNERYGKMLLYIALAPQAESKLSGGGIGGAMRRQPNGVGSLFSDHRRVLPLLEFIPVGKKTPDSFQRR